VQATESTARLLPRTIKTAVCLIAGACALGVKCEREPVRFIPVNSQYLEWYTLREAADETHTIAVQEVGTRKTWYRERLPGLHLGHFQVAKARAARYADGKIAVHLPITAAYYHRLASWTREHMGQHTGFLLDGRLIYVVRIKSEIRGSVAIPAFSTFEEAKMVVEKIKGGGAPLEAASQPASQRMP